VEQNIFTRYNVRRA